jgi:hypothetical protein
MLLRTEGERERRGRAVCRPVGMIQQKSCPFALMVRRQMVALRNTQYSKVKIYLIYLLTVCP